MYRILLLAFLLFPAGALAQPSRVIQFPDAAGYATVVTDLHLHTVFSDGSVWPDIRVQEALRDGVEVIALTEHLEYQPHHHDIPHPDRNRSHEVALESADGQALIVVRGSEITRSMPPGHANAVFIEDANALLGLDSLAVFREAHRQGAFIFWNHPMWTSQAPDGVARLSSFHEELLAEGLLHGIEVVNDVTYSDEALQIALDHDLTIMGTSDIHGLIDWQFGVPEGGHRPVTLVLATERTPSAVREALFAGRTVVWYDDILVGRPEHLEPLLEATLGAANVRYEDNSSMLHLVLENRSSAPLHLRNRSAYTFQSHADFVIVPPHGSTSLQVRTLSRVPNLTLDFEVLNAVTAPNTHPVITVPIRTE